MYKIIRFYETNPGETPTINTGLTLEEARAHCRDKETSSLTCTTQAARTRTRIKGAWFDGYTGEGGE